MLPTDTLKELGWSDELISAFERAGKQLAPLHSVAQTTIDGVSTQIDLGFSTTLDVSGSPVASASIHVVSSGRDKV